MATWATRTILQRSSQNVFRSPSVLATPLLSRSSPYPHLHSQPPRRSFTFSTRRAEEEKGRPANPQANKKKADDEEEEPPRKDNDFLSQPGAFQFPGGFSLPLTNNPLADAALTTMIGLGMVFAGGIAYVAWYKRRVLQKIEQAFEAGYDPALELATHLPTTAEVGSGGELAGEVKDLRRAEQDRVDDIIQGIEKGHYYILLGPKGGGKTTMILDAMRSCKADGVAMCEAHPDLEVFRLRLGKAINYEYNEDSQTGLFQRRDPREGGPRLDIERAFNKLEKVALRAVKRRGKPLVLVINNVHLFPNNEDGKNLLVQLQQRAEAWSESGIITLVLSLDDFWPYLTLRKYQNRMTVVPVSDLRPNEAMWALRNMRRQLKKPDPPEGDDLLREIIKKVGGRLSLLSKVSRTKDMEITANMIVAQDKGWLGSQIGLIEDHDDDVMDEQKWSACSWLLLQEFVKIYKEQETAQLEMIAAGAENVEDVDLPAIPYYRCRQIMTRPDFLEELDRLNIISIDVHLDVRPDSMVILKAAQEVVDEEGFQEVLDNVRQRIDDIESLHRTRELTFKDLEEGDLVRLAVDRNGKRRLTGWFS